MNSVTTLEPVTIEHLDFDFERACDCVNCNAGHPKATHIVIPHMFCTCHPVKLACPDCVRRWQELLLIDARFDSCSICNKPQPGPLRDLIEIRPL